MKKLWKELKIRWKATMPRFWVKVRNISITIGTSALAIVQANQIWSLGIPPDIITICGYIVAVCAGMGLSSQLTTTIPDPPK